MPGSTILGLTGSLGSGKSFVASLLLDAQCRVICADALAREVVLPGSPILAKIIGEFGESVLGPDGALDRARMGKIVFANPAKRRLLESLIHPEVRRRELEFIETNRGFPLVVLDIPLLYESGFDRECDKVAVVVVDETVRAERLRRDRNLTDEQITARLQAQMPQEEKAARADFVIDNSGTRAATARQVRRMLSQLFPNGLPQPLDDTRIGTFE